MLASYVGYIIAILIGLFRDRKGREHPKSFGPDRAGEAYRGKLGRVSRYSFDAEFFDEVSVIGRRNAPVIHIRISGHDLVNQVWRDRKCVVQDDKIRSLGRIAPLHGRWEDAKILGREAPFVV